MPVVDIQVIEGVLAAAQKRATIEKTIDAMVEIEGEAMGGVTLVRVHEVVEGPWGTAGSAVAAGD